MNKIICINDIDAYLTKGKIYYFSAHSEEMYRIIDDENEINDYYKFRFITIQEYRNNKLKLILND